MDTSIQRTPAQGHVRKPDIELYAKIAPHMTQALTLSNMIGSLSARWQLSLQVLQQLPHRLLVLDAAGHVMFANRAAEGIVTPGDGIGISRGEVTASRPTDMPRLGRLVTNATSGRGGGMLRLERPSGRRAYALFTAPFEARDVLSLSNRPTAIIAILDPERRSRLAPEILQALYSLSPREAQVALLISEGLDTRAIAIRQHLARNRRQQLKAVLRKMDVSRQQYLVGVLSSIGSTAL